MASDNKIRIEIDADAAGVKTGAEQAKVSLEKVNDSVADLGNQSDKTTDKIEQISPALNQAGQQASKTSSVFKTATDGLFSGFSLLFTLAKYLTRQFALLQEHGVPAFYAIGLTVLKARANLNHLIESLKVLMTDLRQRNFAALSGDLTQVGKDFGKLASDIVNWRKIAEKSFHGLQNMAEKLGHAVVGIGKKLWESKQNDIKRDVGQTDDGLIARTLITGLAAKKAAEFEKSFADVRKVLSGSDEDIKRVDATLRRLSAGAIPLTYEELAKIAEAGASMGMTANDIEPFINAVAQASTAFGMTADEAGSAFGKLKNIYGLTTQELTLLADQINFVADNAPGSVVERDVINVLQRIGELGKGFGLLRGQAISLASALMVTGDAPENISTALVSLLSKLQTAGSQSEDFQVGLKALNLTSDGLANSIKTNANGALDDFLSRLSELDSASRAGVITAMFGTGGDAILIGKLVAQLDTLRALNKTAGDSAKYAGSSYQAFVKQLDTTDSRITMLVSSLKNLGAAMTEPIMPALNALSDNTREFFNRLNQLAAQNPLAVIVAQVIGLTSAFAGIFRLLTFALSGWGAKLLLFATGASTWAGAMALVSGSLLRFGVQLTASSGLLARVGLSIGVFGRALWFLIGGPIGAAITAVMALIAIWEKYKTKVVEVAGQHATLEQVVKAAFSVMYNAADEVVNNIASQFDSLVSRINSSWEQIATSTKSWLDRMQADDDSYIGAVLRGRQALIDYLVNRAEENANKPSFFEKMGKKSDRQNTIETAIAAEIQKQTATAPTVLPPEKKEDSTGRSVDLTALKDNTDKANSLAKSRLDYQLETLKREQDAKKQAADLALKQLETAFNQEVFDLQTQLVSKLITQEQFAARELALKSKLEKDKLEIQRKALIESAALEKAKVAAQIEAAKAESTALSQDFLEAELVKKSKQYGFNLAAVQAAFAEASAKYGVNETVLKAQAYQESKFNPKAVSPVGAVGFSQFMPGTAKDFGLTDRTNPVASIFAQAKYMSQLQGIFGGDVSKALAGYNWGAGKKGSEHRAAIDSGNLGLLPNETSGYIKAIVGDKQDSTLKLKSLNNQLVDIDSKLNADLKALGFDALNNQTEQNKAALEIKKDRLDKDKQLNEQKIQNEHDVQADELALKEQQSQFELDAGLITQEEQLARLREFANEKYRIELELLNKKLALLDAESLAYKQTQDQITGLERQRVAELTALANKGTLEQQKQFNELFQPVENALNSMVGGVLQGTQTIKQATQKAAQSMVLSYANAFIQKRLIKLKEWAFEISGLAGVEAQKKAIQAASWLWELLGFGTKETTKTAIKVTGEAAQTAATATGTSARGAIESAANAKSILKTAYKAGAKAFESVFDAVPFPFNLILAPIAGAAAFAGTMAFGSAKGGDYEVKKDGQLYELHKQEMVLPAHLANPLRQLIESGQIHGNWGIPAGIAQIPYTAQQTAESRAKDYTQAMKRRATFANELEGMIDGTPVNNTDKPTSAGGEQHTHHWTIQAIDPVSFSQYLEKHGGEAMAKVAEKQVRNFKGKR